MEGFIVVAEYSHDIEQANVEKNTFKSELAHVLLFCSSFWETFSMDRNFEAAKRITLNCIDCISFSVSIGHILSFN